MYAKCGRIDMDWDAKFGRIEMDVIFETNTNSITFVYVLLACNHTSRTQVKPYMWNQACKSSRQGL